MRIAFTVRVVAATIAAMCAGCADNIGPPPAGFSNPAAAQSLGNAYRLGIGDKLKITVFGEENLSGPVEVNAVGQVGLPLAGDVPAQGLTLNQFRQSVEKRLAEGYLNSPRVTVEITAYRPIYIHGEVKSGGEFPFKNGLKLRDAVAIAGGFTYRANEKFVYVAREGQSEAKIAMSGDLLVLPGDNIRVPERFF